MTRGLTQIDHPLCYHDFVLIIKTQINESYLQFNFV